MWAEYLKEETKVVRSVTTTSQIDQAALDDIKRKGVAHDKS